jgi:O-succinylbenzoic acid--CoA ligase
MTYRIFCPVREGAVRHADRIATIESGGPVSYGDFDRKVDKIAARLAASGAGPGDVVAVLADNNVESAALLFASLRHGFVMMPLNLRLNAEEWRRQIALARCTVLLYDEPFARFAGTLDVTTLPIRAVGGPPGAGTGPGAPAAGTQPGRDGLIVFTSGSRGEPGGVVLSWSSIDHSARAAASVLQPGPEDCWLAVLPFYHIGGISIVYRMMAAGGSVSILPRYSGRDLARRIRESRIDFVSLVPTMLFDLLRYLPGDKHLLRRLRRMKAIVVGGAASDARLKKRILELDLPVLTTYGMTETASMVTLLDPDNRKTGLDSSGRCLPGTELAIADERGKPLPARETGRIVVRGKSVFTRYLGRDKPAVGGSGWFDTGDLGWLDEDGYLTVRGRADRVIVSGGENIDLERIEAAIAAQPGVRSVHVLDRPDRRWGARPVAFVEPEPQAEIGLDRALKENLRRSLPRIMIPEDIVLVDRIPLTGSGKYDHHELRRRHAELFDPGRGE